MNAFKKKMQQNIVNPVGETDRVYKTDGVIMSSSPELNTCTVEYTNNNGKKNTKRNVPVRIYAQGIVGWFPEPNDIVVLEGYEDNLEVISVSSTGYVGGVKSRLKLKSDVVTDSLIDTSNGFLF